MKNKKEIVKKEEADKSGQDTSGNKEKKSYFWPAISAILGILLLISAFSGSSKSSPSDTGKDEVSAKMQAFIQDTLLQGAVQVSIENITEEKGLYKFSVIVDGKPAAVSYATKDGAILFTQAIDVENAKKQVSEAKAKQEEAPKLNKTDVPKVQLFVMSQCPYGIQAENAIKPVLDALKNKISFELRFIANRNDDGTFSSLHGQPEVQEDMRQACAMNVYANYMDYVICRNSDIKGSDWQSCAAKNNINAELIKACSEGSEGEGLLARNIALGNKMGVGSSPTVIINSQNYRGQRTPESFLTAICSTFNNPPKECSEQLGTEQTPVDEAPHTGCGA
ncbi:Gamma interferon inducible lysosomal thiol reductase (GILT) [uncultured archaeon]|nr:Gamma interferon inducible lysosomal thiol reductase (GILT) [uncultured archaeon]